MYILTKFENKENVQEQTWICFGYINSMYPTDRQKLTHYGSKDYIRDADIPMLSRAIQLVPLMQRMEFEFITDDGIQLLQYLHPVRDIPADQVLNNLFIVRGLIEYAQAIRTFMNDLEIAYDRPLTDEEFMAGLFLGIAWIPRKPLFPVAEAEVKYSVKHGNVADGTAMPSRYFTLLTGITCFMKEEGIRYVQHTLAEGQYKKYGTSGSHATYDRNRPNYTATSDWKEWGLMFGGCDAREKKALSNQFKMGAGKKTIGAFKRKIDFMVKMYNNPEKLNELAGEAATLSQGAYSSPVNHN